MTPSPQSRRNSPITAIQRWLTACCIVAAVFILACDNGCFWQDLDCGEEACCISLQSIVTTATAAKVAPLAVTALPPGTPPEPQVRTALAPPLRTVFEPPAPFPRRATPPRAPPA